MNASGVLELPDLKRGQVPIASLQRELTDELESGAVISLTSVDFPMSRTEAELLNPRILAGAKNVSYTPATDKLGGTSCLGAEAKALKDVMSRYSRTAREQVAALFPIYKDALKVMRTSLRPAEIAGRKSSWRQDDTLLHIDAFPSQPTHGNRILRVFCNVNRAGKPRVWRLGEPFEDVARRFLPNIGSPFPGAAFLKHLIRVTKTEESEYDFIMLKLHDAMKADEGYQHSVGQTPVEFKPGTTWICFADSVSHAVLSGQHQFEQTLIVPLDAMRHVIKSPLRILERMRNRKLV